jgi:hypothetical protein
VSYARGTSVSVDRTQAEIRRLVLGAGGVEFAVAEREVDVVSTLTHNRYDPQAGVYVLEKVQAKAMEYALAFRLTDRRVQFRMRTKPWQDFVVFKPGRHHRSEGQARAKADQHQREQWRALYVTIKAKLVSVESGVETFEEAFLAHVVVQTDDGPRRIADLAAPAIAAAYSGRPLPPLLLGAGS